MTFRFATIAALALVVLSPPAFAHGGGHGMSGHGMSHSMPSYMASRSTMGGNQKSTGPNHRVQEQMKVGTLVSSRLLSLSKQLFAAVQAGNQAQVIKILGELKSLSLLDASFHLTSSVNLGGGETVEIGVGAHGDVAVNGPAVGM